VEDGEVRVALPAAIDPRLVAFHGDRVD